MEQRHRDILLANGSEIASHLRFKDIRWYLMDNGVLNRDNVDEIESQPNEVEALLDILPTRGPNAFSVFREALQKRYPHLSRLLGDEGSSGDTETKEPRVFIIHAGEDKGSFVRPLVSTLQEKGLDKDDIFFDEMSIKPGEVIGSRIKSTLGSDNLQLAVIVVSTSLLNKDYWPKLEFETCLQRQKRIFPIWVDENQDNFKKFSELVGKYSPTLKQLSARRVQRDSVEEEMSSVAAEIIQRLSPPRKRLSPPPMQALLYVRPTGTPSSDSSSSSGEEPGIGIKRRHVTGDNDEEVIEKKLKEDKFSDLDFLHKKWAIKIDLLKKVESILPREEIEAQARKVFSELDEYDIDILKVKSGCAVIHLVPNNDDSLERFWTDYRSRQLSRNLSKYLITDEMRDVAGQDLMIGVIILEEQYRQWKEYFQVREEDIQLHERLEDELRLSVLNQDSPPEIQESQLSYAFTTATVEDVRVRSGTATGQQNITQGGAEWEAEHQDSGKAVDSQKPDVGSSVQGHTTQAATSPLHMQIFKISQELTDKDVQTVKDKIRIDQGEERMASYENLTNLTEIFKQLEADNYLGSDDDEKLTNTLKLFDGVEDFDSRHFEFLQQLDIENARKNTAFVGRDKDIENLMDRINADGDNGHVKIIWINGFPGVGKTTFAHQLCLKQGRRKIFISLGKVTSVDNMLTLIMREFGVTEINGDSNTEIDATVAHLIGSYDSEGCSLVLDDADSLLEAAESRRRLVGFLAKVQDKQSPKFHVIVTSRSSVMSSGDVPRMEATIVDLKELTDPAGTVLVQTLVGKSNIIEKEAFEVSRRCKGWPLAITIACGVIRKDHLQPAEMIKRLGNLTEISDIRGFLTDVVSTLSTDLLATLKLVSVFAGPFTVESACIISGRPGQLFQVWSHLRELRTRSLIKAGSHSIGASGFDTHDVVRTFVSNLDSDVVTVQEMAAAKYSFQKLYEERLATVAQNMQGNIQKALDSYSRDVDNFNHFLSLIQKETQDDYEWRRKERDDNHTWLMDVKTEEVADRSAVHILLEQMMVVNERIAFYTGQAERSEKQNTQIYAEMLCWLAETYLQVNMHQEAQEQLEKARKALETRPDRGHDSVQLSFARYHYVSGIYFSLRDNYKQNVRHLDQALEILSRVKIAGNHVLHARVMNSLGFAHHNQAKNMWRGPAYLEMLQNSLAMHQKAHDHITSAVGQDNHFDCATYLMNIGVVYLDIGWYFGKSLKEADQYFEKALGTFSEAEKLVKVMALEKQHNSGLLQYNIARCYEALGDLDEAIRRVRRAQKVLQNIYDSHPDIADCLYFIGKLNKDNGDTTSAMKYYKQSLEHTAELGNRRSEYEWKRLKKAIMEICKSQEKAWYRQQFEKIDGTPYTESMSTRLTGLGSRIATSMLRPIYTFISDVWKPKP